MRILLLVGTLLLLGAGCGKEIGDKCVVNSDCSQAGDRQCDSSSKEGYCTIQGCDVGTCPEEAVCVRFFTGSFSNLECNPDTEDKGGPSNEDLCSPDEICALVGHCVPRSSEVRFCMRTCDSDGDCRDGYECRGVELMKAHGGAPVGIDNPDDAKFCAIAP